MLIFKKIVAALLMILSVAAVVTLIIAFFGSWVVRDRLETASVNLLLTGESVIATTQDGLDRVGEILNASYNVVTDVDVKVRELGTRIQEGEPVVEQVLNSIGIDLRSHVENAVSGFDQIEANIIAIHDAYEAIKAIPLLGLDSRFPSQNKLQQVKDGMARIREDVTTLAQTIQNNRADLMEGKSGAVTEITTRISERLDTTRSDLEEANANLAASAQSMADLRARIPGIYTTITVLLDVFMLLAILAFGSLFLHAWEYFKCPEQGFGNLLPDDCEKALVVSEEEKS